MSSGRIPTLDGVRAISIGLVLAAHAIGTGAIPMHKRAAHLFGDVGVRTFFVLSGFLITTLLIREHAKHGSISLKNFYVRRVLRIFPAFYLYLAVAAVLAALGWVALGSGDMLAAATYTMNFHVDREWTTGHLWSLAVEEQFYLVWPFVVVALGFGRSWGFAIGAFALAPVVRLAIWYGAPDHRALVDQAFPCVFDALATGCLLALARDRLVTTLWFRRILDAWWFWWIPGLFIGSLIVTRPWIQYGVSMTLANVGIAIVMLRCVTRPETMIGRILETPALAWIGTLSYSLYLWQQLFVNRHADGFIHAFPLNIACAFAAAIACHYIVERPILKLSSRFRDRAATTVRVVEVPGVLSDERVLEVRPRAKREPKASLPMSPLTADVRSARKS